MNFKELKNRLLIENINKSSYSFKECNMGDCMVMIYKNFEWLIYYTERGNIYGLKKFIKEEEACNYFYEKVINMK